MALVINTDRFHRAAQSLREGVEQEVAAMLNEEAPGMVDVVQNATPPAHDGLSLSDGIQHGQSLVAADVHRVVIPVAVSRAEMGVRDAMSRYRINGRVPAQIAKRILVARADMESYIAEKKTHVGNLARGWFARVKSSGGRITLLLGNAVPYAANVTGLQAHANEALRSQLHRLQDRAVTAVAKAAKNAGFKS